MSDPRARPGLGPAIDPGRASISAVADRLALIVLLTGMAVSLLWLVHPYYHPRGDTAIYIRTAEALLDGEGYSYMGQPFVVRPPGLSILLVPILYFWKGSFYALNLFTNLLGLLCVAALFLFVRNRVGTLVAFALCCAIWLGPGFRQLTSEVLSDVPGTALLIGCLLLERRFRREPSVRTDSVLGLLIGLSSYVRTASLILIPAIVLSRVLRREISPGSWPTRVTASIRRSLMLVAVPLLMLVPWQLRNASLAPSGPMEELRIHSYAVAMWHADKGDPGSRKLTPTQILSRIPEMTSKMLGALSSRMQSARSTLLGSISAVIGLACWLVVLIRRREPAELFVALYLLVISVYFGFAIRLALPVYLFVLSAVAEIVRLAMSRFATVRTASMITAGLIVILMIAEFNPRPHWKSLARHQRELRAVSDYLTERYSPDAVFAAHNGRHLAVMLDRPVHTLTFAYERDGAQRVFEILEERRVCAVLAEASQPLTQQLLRRYPLVSSWRYYLVLEIDSAACGPAPERRGDERTRVEAP
ncbi:MAG: hypothetical protein JSV80_00665 [Acidobacteriota bacterium]|nr:MAG: hypothetical protein JSV80_00665 [Acidobacteriota bacterium]